VKIGAAARSGNVEEEEQIPEAQFVPTVLTPRGGIHPALDDTLAALVVVVVLGAGKRKRRHCIASTANRLAISSLLPHIGYRHALPSG
jgi:hypothetical protein